MSQTKIEWADTVWNPVTGCTKVSEGCRNCYAERMSKRLAGRCGYPADDPFKVTLHHERLYEPWKWKKPKRIFVNSMSDLFHPDIPFEFIRRLFAIMRRFNQNIFMILTKRPERMRKFINWYKNDWLKVNEDEWKRNYGHIWIGVSVENQAVADERIPLLLQTPAAVRFISAEPLLGAIDLTSLWGVCPECGSWEIYEPRGDMRYCDDCGADVPIPKIGIDWVITGGETGPGARPMHPDWVRSLRDQCQAAGVPFFFKSWGEFAPDDEGESDNLPWVSEETDRSRDRVIDMRGDDRTNWEGPDQVGPFALMRHVGKKKAGSSLDGRTWEEFPVAKA